MPAGAGSDDRERIYRYGGRHSGSAGLPENRQVPRFRDAKLLNGLASGLANGLLFPAAMTRALIVDDEPSMRFAVHEALEAHGIAVISVDRAAEAFAHLDDVDVVVSDYMMPDLDGMQLLERIAATHPSLPVVLVTAHGSERLAVRALQRGAYDYLSKPFDNDELCHVVDRAAETYRLRQSERERALEASSGVRIIGRSPALVRLLDTAARVAAKDVTVLVRGETGTGKELAASALHALSGRTGPFVPVNCGAMPASLAASELFGYRKGAFSGAVDDRPGLVRTADKGTLFLDEVGDLPPDVQASLLRVLQEGEVLPLGAAKAVAADVRVVAATHRDLEAMVASGEFRQDLFSRLSGFTLRLPPLRARREDLGLMLAAIGKRKLGREVALRSSSARRLFAAPFTRNVRELEQAMVVASTLSADEPLDLTLAGGTDAATEQAGDADLKARLEAALKAHDGNISKVAKEMGKARMQIHRWMKRFGLEPSAKEKD